MNNKTIISGDDTVFWTKQYEYYLTLAEQKQALPDLSLYGNTILPAMKNAKYLTEKGKHTQVNTRYKNSTKGNCSELISAICTYHKHNTNITDHHCSRQKNIKEGIDYQIDDNAEIKTVQCKSATRSLQYGVYMHREWLDGTTANYLTFVDHEDRLHFSIDMATANRLFKQYNKKFDAARIPFDAWRANGGEIDDFSWLFA